MDKSDFFLIVVYSSRLTPSTDWTILQRKSVLCALHHCTLPGEQGGADVETGGQQVAGQQAGQGHGLGLLAHSGPLCKLGSFDKTIWHQEIHEIRSNHSTSQESWF